MTTVYIAGPITGDPDYKEKFDAVEKKLQELGLETVNPTEDAPKGLTHREYIDRGLTMLATCNMICMLPGSSRSPGAKLERAYADTVMMPILEAYMRAGDWHISGAD